MKFVLSFLLLAATAAAADLPQPVLRWKLDGNADEAGGVIKGETAGRVVYFDSPIGDGGQLLSLNGIDTSIKIPMTKKILHSEFSLSLWILCFDKRDSAVWGGYNPAGLKQFALKTTASGALNFRFSNVEGGVAVIQTPDSQIAPSQWYHIVATASDGEDEKMLRLFINGLERASTKIIFEKPAKSEDPKGFFGLLDDIQIFDKPLTPEQVRAMTDAGMPWLRKSAERTALPANWNTGKLEFQDHDVVAFVGGEDMVVANELGYLETLMTLAAGPKKVHFRCMAWEGDTVYEQARVLNFGSWRAQFERAGVSVIVAQFGQMEALQGKEKLPEFIAAYEKLIDEFQKTTKRIVLIAPAIYEGDLDFEDQLSSLQEYHSAIKKVAENRKLLFVDFPTMITTRDKLKFTREGLHLSEVTHRILARGFAELAHSIDYHDEDHDHLRITIIEKNRLWTDYWRPSNWAFLAGDRTEQPSSRDHADPRIRWFPAEVQKYPALIKREEEKIWKLAAEIQK